MFSLIPDYTVEIIRRAKSGEEKGFFQINGKQEDFPKDQRGVII